MLRYLIAQNVPVEKRDDSGQSAAMLAIGGCSKCLEELLNKTTRVSEWRLREKCHYLKSEDRCRDNFTLVHLATQEDDLDAMDILSHHKVDSGLDFGIFWTCQTYMTSSYHSNALPRTVPVDRAAKPKRF